MTQKSPQQDTTIPEQAGKPAENHQENIEEQARNIAEALCQQARQNGKPDKAIRMFFTEKLDEPAEGHAVDAWLLCGKEEKGYLVPVRYRGSIIPIMEQLRPGTKVFSMGGETVTLGSKPTQAELFETGKDN